MHVVLKFKSNNSTLEISLELYKTIVIGRSKQSDHKIMDTLMSGKHCKIVFMPSKLEIFDLKSRNGTLLNGLRVEHAQIFVGDEIKLGDTILSIVPEKMDKAAVESLTFCGAAKDRQSHGLKLDFTGARMINQKPDNTYANERKIRKTIKELESKIKK